MYQLGSDSWDRVFQVKDRRLLSVVSQSNFQERLIFTGLDVAVADEMHFIEGLLDFPTVLDRF